MQCYEKGWTWNWIPLYLIGSETLELAAVKASSEEVIVDDRWRASPCQLRAGRGPRSAGTADDPGTSIHSLSGYLQCRQQGLLPQHLSPFL